MLDLSRLSPEQRQAVLAPDGPLVIVVTFGYTTIPPRELGADAVIESFTELPALFGL